MPVPDEGHSLTQALLKAVLLRRGRSSAVEGRQIELFERHWEDAKAKAKRNRTVFAQRRIKPEEVLPEWHKSLAAVGGRDDVERFARPCSRPARLRARAAAVGDSRSRRRRLPAEVRERLETEDIAGTVAIDFSLSLGARMPSRSAEPSPHRGARRHVDRADPFGRRRATPRPATPWLATPGSSGASAAGSRRGCVAARRSRSSGCATSSCPARGTGRRH